MYLVKTNKTANDKSVKTIIEEREPDEIATDSDKDVNNLKLNDCLCSKFVIYSYQNSAKIRSIGSLDSFVDKIHKIEEEIVSNACNP